MKMKKTLHQQRDDDQVDKRSTEKGQKLGSWHSDGRGSSVYASVSCHYFILGFLYREVWKEDISVGWKRFYGLFMIRRGMSLGVCC